MILNHKGLAVHYIQTKPFGLNLKALYGFSSVSSHDHHYFHCKELIIHFSTEQSIEPLIITVIL